MTTEQGSRSFYREESCNRNPNIASRSTREMFPSGELRQSSRHQCSQGLGNSVTQQQRSHRKPCPVHSSRKSRALSVSRDLKISKPKCPSDQDFSGLTRQLQGMFPSKIDTPKQSEFEKIADLTDKMGLNNEELDTERDFCDVKHLAAGEQATKEPELPGKRRSSSLPKNPRKLSTIDGHQYEPLATHNQETQTKPLNIPLPHNVPTAFQNEINEETPPKPFTHVTKNQSSPQNRHLEQFMNLSPQKRPELEFMNLPPRTRPEFMNAPPQNRPGSQFRTIPPRNRPQSEFMNIPPQIRPDSEFMTIPPHHRPESEFMKIPPQKRPESEFINIPPQNRPEPPYMNIHDKSVCERQEVPVEKNVKSSPENVESEGYGDVNAYKYECPLPSAEDDRGYILENKKEDPKIKYFVGENENSKNDHGYDLRNKNMDSKNDQFYNFEGRNDHVKFNQRHLPDFGNKNANYSRIDRPFNFEERDSRIDQCHEFGKKYVDPRIHHDPSNYYGNKDVDPRMHHQPHNFGDRNEDPRIGQCYDFRNKNADPRIQHQYSNFGDRNEDFTIVGKRLDFEKNNNIDPRIRQSSTFGDGHVGKRLDFEKNNNFDPKIRQSSSFGDGHVVTKIGHFGNMHEDSRIHQSSNFVNRYEDSKIGQSNDFRKDNVDPRIEQGYNFGDRNENSRIAPSHGFENVDSRTNQSNNFGDRIDEFKMKNEESEIGQYKDFKDKDVNYITDGCQDFQDRSKVGFREQEGVAEQQMIDKEAGDDAECTPKINPVGQQATTDICQPEINKACPPEKVSDSNNVQDINSSKTRKPKMNVCLKLVKNKNGEICVVNDNGCGCCNHK